MLEKESAPPWMIVREEGALSDERFDEYLFASDAVIFHKYQNRYLRLLSATIFQVMGAGCCCIMLLTKIRYIDWARQCSAWKTHQKYYTGILSLLSSRKRIMKYGARSLMLYSLVAHARYIINTIYITVEQIE